MLSIIRGIIFSLSLILTATLSAETIDLGASEIQGKKDAPQAMTFISRALLDESGKVAKFDSKSMIKEEIKTTRIFDVIY